MEQGERHWAQLRARMVEEQLVGRGIRDARVLSAMAAVPRERFLPEEVRARAYDDSALPIGEEQTISQPYIVARTCELAALHGQETVLEVGAGSGYQAAVLGSLARRVVAVEVVPSLAERARAALAEAELDNVEVIEGDGSLGHPPASPYDAIVVAAAAPEPPAALVAQLAVGGRLVAPVGSRFMQRLRLLEKGADGQIGHRDHEGCVFVPLLGAHGWS